jgi:hypothetical protein
VFVCNLYEINTSHRVRPVGEEENLGGLLLILGLTNLGRTLLGEKRHQVTRRLAVNLSTVLQRQQAPFSGAIAGDRQLEP